MMSRIVVEAEQHMRVARSLPAENGGPHLVQALFTRLASQAAIRTSEHLSIAETICESAAHAAEDLNMRAIVVFTDTGTTARLISKYRPRCPIYAFARDSFICNRMKLFWGVESFDMQHVRNTAELIATAERTLLERGLVAPNDIVGIVTGTRLESGFTNLMLLRTIKEENNPMRAERRRVPRYKPLSKR
jgi:pyruvate kinase